MFSKSLQTRLILIYLLIVITIVMVVGIFLLNSVENVFYKVFYDTVVIGFERKGINLADVESETSLKEIAANDLTHVLGIYGFYRNLYILDDSYRIIYPESKAGDPINQHTKGRHISRNLMQVYIDSEGTGKERNAFYESYFDFAQRFTIRNGKSYILYVQYDKDEWKGAMDDVKKYLILSAAVATLICLILGYFLSKTITTPISKITIKAQKMAHGDFELIEQNGAANDEIGQLTASFNYMAGELKKTLNEISSEKNKVETILKFMTDGIVAFNLSGKIIHVNHTAQQLLKPDAENEDFDIFFKRLNVDITMNEILGMEKQKAVERIIFLNGYYLEIIFVPFTGETQQVEGIIAVIHDITQKQKLDNMRKEFVANVSHELKTPITIIRNYVETLLNGAIEDPGTAKQFLSVVESESERMTRLVRDLLQLSAMDAGNSKWVMQRLRLDIIAREAVNKIRIEAEIKEQTLTYEHIGEMKKFIGDRDRVEQVIINILSNAINYTHSGGRIEVITGSEDEKVYLKVRDNGIGIPAEDLPNIFERFYRVDKARSRALGGTGLGLSIAKEIVEAHGGNISIKSEVKKGTEVTISFPAAVDDKALTE